MRLPGRLAAAIEILEDVLGCHRPVAIALADWGKANRFAGASDRAAIGNLVYDALRRRASIRWAFDADTPRALALGAARDGWSVTAEDLIAIAASEHGPGALTAAEIAALARLDGASAPEAVQAELPEWLWARFAAQDPANAIAEGRALATRAPVDLRVNTLKANRERVQSALELFAPLPTPWSPIGLRIAAPAAGGRTPNVQSEPAFLKGWFEVQDEASQLAALIAIAAAEGRGPVLDLCAGGGGKTLAIAAGLGNRGQVFAYDDDKQRLAPIHDRLKRAGTHNVQVLVPRLAALQAISGTLGTIVIDAPCSGSGAWRRRPETKWKLTPEALERRVAEQQALLDQAVGLLKPRGRIVYVTCSLLAEENSAQIEAFCERQPGWQVWSGERLAALLPTMPPARMRTTGLTLSPASTGTDGFFIAVLEAPA